MDSKLDIILESLKNIESRLERLEKDSSKMSDHISFIHTTYNLVRGPLNYIKSYIGTNTTELPMIENNNDK